MSQPNSQLSKGPIECLCLSAAMVLYEPLLSWMPSTVELLILISLTECCSLSKTIRKFKVGLVVLLCTLLSLSYS